MFRTAPGPSTAGKLSSVRRAQGARGTTEQRSFLRLDDDDTYEAANGLSIEVPNNDCDRSQASNTTSPIAAMGAMFSRLLTPKGSSNGSKMAVDAPFGAGAKLRVTDDFESDNVQNKAQLRSGQIGYVCGFDTNGNASVWFEDHTALGNQWVLQENFRFLDVVEEAAPPKPWLLGSAGKQGASSMPMPWDITKHCQTASSADRSGEIDFQGVA